MPISITIPNNDGERIDTLLPAIQARKLTFISYQDQNDQLDQIRALGGVLDILDFICHGSPTGFADIDLSEVDVFGGALASLPNFSPQTAIYLDGCNTGLRSDFGGPIAQYLADATGCKVYGSQGYMTDGSFALDNAECFDSLGSYGPYPNSKNAFGDDVWIEFVPTGGFFVPGVTHRATLVKINTETGDRQSENELSKILEEAIGYKEISEPEPLVFPDVSIETPKHQIFDVYSNGTVIKDRKTGKRWAINSSQAINLRKYILRLR